MLRRFAAAPSEYVMKYSRGELEQEGLGLNFLYHPRTTTVVCVPMASMDASFAFTERSSDFQPLSIEGDIYYRIADPRKAASVIDFSTRHGGTGSRDAAMRSLRKRVVGVARDLARDEVKCITAEEAASAATDVGRALRIRMAHSSLLAATGVRVMGVPLRKIKAPSEVVSALETHYLDSITRESRPGEAPPLLLAGSQLSRGANDMGASHEPGSVACTDSCPFRHMCGDYMSNLRDGNARCTLFRGFPV